jgi:hypothetical protein
MGHDEHMDLPRELTDGEARVVREALTGRPSWLELARALEETANATEAEALRMLSLVFVYDLVGPRQDARRAAVGGPYASMIESKDGIYPPRPAEVLEEVRLVWRSAREHIDDPIVDARVSDLLYVAEGKAAHEEGRRAARGLAELAGEPDWEVMDRATCMARSIEILVELNDRDGLAEALERAEAVVIDLLAQKHPGPPLTVLRSLVALKKELRPNGLEDLLDRAIERFPAGHAGESALELAADASNDPERQKELRRRQLQVRIDEAAAAEGLAKVTVLQRAIELARRFGFTKEVEALLKEQQDLPREDLGFESMEVSIDLPTEEIREQVDLIVGTHAADIFQALKRLGGFGPPGGSNVDIDGEVEAQEKESIANLFSHSAFGTETSSPTFLAGEEENKRLMSRGRQRQFHVDFYGRILYAPMLDEALDRHGRPSREDLAEHFSTELIGEDRGERIARAVEFFWDEEYDEAAHLIVPRLESILRDVARLSGIPIVRPAEEGRFTGVVSLNVVLSKLRELYEPAPWFDYFEALLCDPLATNLRNDIAHGIRRRAGGVEAALLIQTACHLTLMREVAGAPDQASPSSADDGEKRED